MTEITLYDASGQPIPKMKKVRVAGSNHPARPMALNSGYRGYSNTPWDAADIYDPHMAAWNPYLWSPDAEIGYFRDRIVARVRDLVRNDGWASGAVTRILDNAIGANLRPIAKPDYRFLALALDNKSYDLEWAKEWEKAVDANWRSWATTDLGRWCDSTRNQLFPDMMRTAFRHKIVDGDALAIMHWAPERMGRGRARYATCVQLIDPDRLSNPQLVFDTNTMRGGVVVDERLGAAVGYYIRRAHEGDWWAAGKSVIWDFVDRETDWGRPVVVHDFDLERADQHRGGTGIFAPILQRLKMLAKYDGVELDSAIINSLFAAYIESPFDPQLVGEALDDGEKMSWYTQQRIGFHDDHASDIMLGNSRIPILFPGEKINATQATRPHGNFEAFEGAVLRNAATCIGLSAQQLTNDWSAVNYSSARGALLEAWKTLHRRRANFAEGFAAPIRAAWLEESCVRDDLPWPNGGAPDFPTFRGALSKCRWLGPALGWLDPVVEAQASQMRMEAGLSTLEDEAASQGLDYEEVIDQRAYEISLFEKHGIPQPAWTGTLAEKAAEKPQPGEGGAKVATKKPPSGKPSGDKPKPKQPGGK